MQLSVNIHIEFMFLGYNDNNYNCPLGLIA